jgi:Tfp pilus assembly protein PilF
MKMTRWLFLLMAGVAALPSGCVTLPYSDAIPHDTAQLMAQLAPTAATELPPAQAAQACLTTGDTLEKQGHDREALLEYQRARQYDPQLPGVARRLAVQYAKQGDMEHARSEFQAALQQQPRDADLLNDLGYFHYQMGEDAPAETAFRKALAINPNHQRAWVNLGKVLVRRGHYEESCEAFGHVVRPAQAAANVGILLAREGKVQEARQVLHKALALEPDLKAARLVLAKVESATPPDVSLILQ